MLPVMVTMIRWLALSFHADPKVSSAVAASKSVPLYDVADAVDLRRSRVNPCSSRSGTLSVSLLARTAKPRIRSTACRASLHAAFCGLDHTDRFLSVLLWPTAL